MGCDVLAQSWVLGTTPDVQDYTKTSRSGTDTGNSNVNKGRKESARRPSASHHFQSNEENYIIIKKSYSQGFAIVVLDGVLAPPRLVRHT